MTTKRTPIRRPPRSTIMPRAVELFIAMRAIRCTCPPDKPIHRKPCRGRDQWWRFNGELCRELRLEPWQFPAIAHRDEHNDARQAALFAALAEAAKA